MNYIYVCSLMVTVSLYGMEIEKKSTEIKKHIEKSPIRKIKTTEDIVAKMKEGKGNEDKVEVKGKRRSMSLDSATSTSIAMGVLALDDISDLTQFLRTEKQGNALKRQKSADELEATNPGQSLLKEIMKQVSSLQING